MATRLTDYFVKSESHHEEAFYKFWPQTKENSTFLNISPTEIEPHRPQVIQSSCIALF